ncbi:MAG TPA: site-specific DNA-methyltransferase [Smithella sp.]|nr:site-specific DNA-methyltransferase [Smithella sp.]
MKHIPEGCIDMILCDLPYGVTKNKWDCAIDISDLWCQYKRIIKSNGCIVLTGQDKFSAKLMMSNEKMHRYNLVWQKTHATGYLNAKKMPLRNHEDILIFYKNLPTYNPQKTTGHKRKKSTANHKRNSKKTTNYGNHELTTYDSTERFPKSVLTFATDKQKSSIHPTQKPVALFEYLIKTYTNPGDIVLDNCVGSGTTAIACLRTNRNYVCIEKEKRYYELILKRIENENKNRNSQRPRD